MVSAACTVLLSMQNLQVSCNAWSMNQMVPVEKRDLQTGSLDGRRIQRGFSWVLISFSHRMSSGLHHSLLGFRV